jgi:trans-aconitate methyltransferase
MDRQQHWNSVFRTKAERDLSWFEGLPQTSIRLLEAAGLSADTCVIDVGGGDSHLIDHLLARGLDCLAVLDVSDAALARAKERLGAANAAIPIWLAADVAGEWSIKPMDIWHDRAVFHFLTERYDRDRYRFHLLETLKPGGQAIVAAFAPDGPATCSGLPVVRYSQEGLAAELAPELSLVEAVPHTHTTPRGSTQSFLYCRFRRVH